MPRADRRARRGAAGLLLACCMAGAAGWPGAVQADTPGPAAAPAVVVQAAQAFAEQDRAAMCRSIAGLSHNALNPEFDAMRQRVDVYADWVYGWIDSVKTAYDLAQIAATDTSTRLAGGEGPDLAAVQGKAEAYVQERFHAIVVGHNGGADAYDAADRRVAQWAAAFDRELAAGRAARIRALSGAAGGDAGDIVAAYGATFLDPEAGPPAPGSLGVASMPAEDVNRVLLRSLRPLASRVAGTAFRMGGLELVAGTAIVQAYEFGAVAGAAATAGVVGAFVWSFDYLANLVDASTGRDALVNDLHAVLDGAQVEAASIVYRAAVVRLAKPGAGLACPPEWSGAGVLAIRPRRR